MRSGSGLYSGFWHTGPSHYIDWWLLYKVLQHKKSSNLPNIDWYWSIRLAEDIKYMWHWYGIIGACTTVTPPVRRNYSLKLTEKLRLEGMSIYWVPCSLSWFLLLTFMSLLYPEIGGGQQEEQVRPHAHWAFNSNARDSDVSLWAKIPCAPPSHAACKLSNSMRVLQLSEFDRLSAVGLDWQTCLLHLHLNFETPCIRLNTHCAMGPYSCRVSRRWMHQRCWFPWRFQRKISIEWWSALTERYVFLIILYKYTCF